jgi:5-methylcytosine-specific restriction protein B
MPTPNDDKIQVCVSSCKNLILYGPPGTGKTHWLRTKFAEYEDAPGHVDDATWLQETLSNYGWRPVIAAVLADLKKPARVPEIRDHRWLIAKAKQRGRTPASCQATLWNFLQEHTPEGTSTVNSGSRRAPFIFSKLESSEWLLKEDWKEQDDEAAQLFQKLTAGSQSAKETIRRYRVVTFHPSFGYEDFVRGIRPVIADETGTAQFRCVDGVFKIICDEARANPAKRYALFIDEINRANIAKVFGELITLIEPDKRAVFDAHGQLVKGMAVQLPGGDGAEVAEPPFGVPENLDIYGTMNTADRSIALLDIALRRRFEFKELAPDYKTIDRDVDGINLGELLQRVNDRLEYCLDRDHRIGHAYLMRVMTLADLQNVFATQIIPLLQEYFFDDLAKVAAVLTTDSTAPPFVESERIRRNDLFPNGIPARIAEDRTRYSFTLPETWAANSFVGLYEANEEAAPQQEPDDAA